MWAEILQRTKTITLAKIVIAEEFVHSVILISAVVNFGNNNGAQGDQKWAFWAILFCKLAFLETFWPFSSISSGHPEYSPFV